MVACLSITFLDTEKILSHKWLLTALEQKTFIALCIRCTEVQCSASIMTASLKDSTVMSQAPCGNCPWCGSLVLCCREGTPRSPHFTGPLGKMATERTLMTGGVLRRATLASATGNHSSNAMTTTRTSHGSVLSRATLASATGNHSSSHKPLRTCPGSGLRRAMLCSAPGTPSGRHRTVQDCYGSARNSLEQLELEVQGCCHQQVHPASSR